MKEQNNNKLIKIEDSPLIEESKDFNKNAPIKNIANDTAIDVDGVSGYVLSSVKRKRISQKTINLTVDENKNVTKTIPPKNYVLKLNTTSTTNYNYSYHSSNKSVANISADLKFNNKGATYIFTFKGLKKGKVTYTIKYQSSNKKLSTKVVKLNVDNKLNVTLVK